MEEHPAVLKILLKTKNDPILLERWIQHHLQIVGPKNIIVFDNMSVDPIVLNVYAQYANQINIVRFSGFHNNVHRVELNGALYSSLAKASDFFVFLDTDEFLVLFDDDANHYHKSEYLTRYLLENNAAKVFPGTWLYNTNWTFNQFVCGTEQKDLINGVAWGKPIINSKTTLKGYINHNVQLDQNYFSTAVKSNFFVLHMANLSPQQRILSNVNKLVSRGFAKEGESAEAICLRNLEGVTDNNVVQYVAEITRLLPLKYQLEARSGTLRRGCMELAEHGQINYFAEVERTVIRQFIHDPTPLIAIAMKQFSGMS